MSLADFIDINQFSNFGPISGLINMVLEILSLLVVFQHQIIGPLGLIWHVVPCSDPITFIGPFSSHKLHLLNVFTLIIDNLAGLVIRVVSHPCAVIEINEEINVSIVKTTMKDPIVSSFLSYIFSIYSLVNILLGFSSYPTRCFGLGSPPSPVDSTLRDAFAGIKSLFMDRLSLI